MDFAECLKWISNGKNPAQNVRPITGSASTSGILRLTHSLLTARSPFEEDWEIRFLRLVAHFYWVCGALAVEWVSNKVNWIQIRGLHGQFRSILAQNRDKMDLLRSETAMNERNLQGVLFACQITCSSNKEPTNNAVKRIQGCKTLERTRNHEWIVVITSYLEL